MTALYIGIYILVSLVIYLAALFAWAWMGYPYAKWYHWSNLGCACIMFGYPIAAGVAGFLIFK